MNNKIVYAVVLLLAVIAATSFVLGAPKTSCVSGVGYWKGHSIYGPSDYDSAWASVGEDTPFFKSGNTYYEIISTNAHGNRYFTLAHEYIAARLNMARGAVPSYDLILAYHNAENIFNVYTPEELTQFGSNDLIKKDMLDYQADIRDYNSGKGVVKCP